MDQATRVVEDVKKMFLRYCHDKLPDLDILGLRNTGSAEEGLKVIKADEFDVMIHLNLDSQRWHLEESDLAPGYWYIKTSTDVITAQSFSPSPRQISGSLLQPNMIIRQFQSIIQKSVNLGGTKYDIRTSTHGPAITLAVTYEVYGEQRHLDIDLVPSISLGSTWLVAKPHPLAQTDPAQYASLWRQSFSFDEYQRINVDLAQRGACHQKCLMILKAIRLNHFSQLGALSSYVYKTLLLQQMALEEDWSDEALPERFYDLLMGLKQALSEGRLDNFFCPGMNLLAGMRAEALENIRYFVIKKMTQDGMLSLLKTNH